MSRLAATWRRVKPGKDDLMELQFIIDLLTNAETIIGAVMLTLGGVVAASKKVRRKLSAAAKAAKETK